MRVNAWSSVICRSIYYAHSNGVFAIKAYVIRPNINFPVRIHQPLWECYFRRALTHRFTNVLYTFIYAVCLLSPEQFDIDDNGYLVTTMAELANNSWLITQTSLSSLHIHRVYTNRWNTRHRRHHRQQPHFRRLLEGKLQVVDDLSLLEPIVNRFSPVTGGLYVHDCVGIRQLYGVAAGLLKSTTLFYSVLVSNSPGKDRRNMGDSTGSRQPVHHRLSTIQGVSMVHSFEGEDTVGCHAHRSCSVQHSEICQTPHLILYHKHARTTALRTWLV